MVTTTQQILINFFATSTMSISQDEIREFNSPKPPPVKARKNKKQNKIGSPPQQSPTVTPSKKADVFELFTIKSQSKNENPPSDTPDTSELSDDVFVKPKPVSASTTSRSETKSYRERINERFKSVKDKAGKSTKKANVFKKTAEKILLEKVKRESSDIDAELEAMRNRMKLGKNTEYQEIYDFFCNEKCIETNIEEEKENFQSTDDLTEDGPEVQYVGPKQNKSLLKNSEDFLLFKATANHVDIIDKIDNEDPRYLEDEGFYVTTNPKIPTHHINLLEQRLSRDDKRWFNCDGSLNIIENPTQKLSYRSNFKILTINQIATFLPARIEDEDCEEIVIVREDLLQLQIFSLKFSHHPLFSLEHVLAEKLKKLYENYEEEILKNDLIRINQRLKGLRKVLKRWDETSSQSGDQSDKEDGKFEVYKRDIKILQNQAFEEGRRQREKMKAILHTWRAIKKLREKNGYSNTSIKLMIKKEKVNYAEDKECFDQNFEEVYEEAVDENREKSKNHRRNGDEIREELLEKFKKSFRSPGEPILYFTLLNNNEITNSVDNPKETSRRNVVFSSKIALKIICNKMEVCKTKWVNLQNDFVCNFDETISIQLITIPKFITIEIIEQPKSLIKRTIGEIDIKIPSRNRKNDQKCVSFEKNEIVRYKHEGVGSGIKVDDLVQDLGLEFESEDLKTCGKVTFMLNWDSPITDEHSPNGNREILTEIIDRNGGIEEEKLLQWMQQHKPDPQDPRNSILYEYCLDYNEEMVPKEKNYFRIDQQMERWKFCDPKLIEENLRLKILQLRNRNEPEFDRMVVPNRIKEIPLDILEDYKRRVAQNEAQSFEEDDEDNEFLKRRNNGKKYLKQLQVRVFQKCKNFENNLTFEDVVDEKLLPHLEKFIKSIVSSFVSWFQWGPLKPPLIQMQTQEVKTVKDYDLQRQVRVVVNIISGLNIPTKLENKKQVVRPFVEVEYNGKVERTETKEGAHPNWNEKVALPLETSHLDYLNPNSLNGTLTVGIFDESKKSLTKFGEQKQKTWLGSVEIPLSAICSSGIQGMFKIRKPYILLGFDKKDTTNKQEKNSQMTHDTFLNLSIVLEPNIPKLTPAIEDLPCADVPYIRDHALTWNEDFNSSFPTRKFSVFAIDTNATTSCIVRYIKPLETPQINVEGFDVTPEQCARFISMIPFTDCNQFYKNIWLPVDKFMQFMIGSIIDHAVALTCYLLALKMDVWLLLGFGIPHGSTAYVLVRENDNPTPTFYVYDVVSGEKNNFTDAFCPVQKVYCVVNEKNVWANIQRNDDVATMRFDFTRRFDWLPLFNNKVAAPTNSIHGIISYLPKPQTEELEIAIDRKIRKKIAKMRPLDRTVWNHQVSNVFKGVLGAIERKEMYKKRSSDAFEQINENTATFMMRGHIFSLLFTDVKTIVSKTKATGLHLEDDDNVQFASAVHLKGYPNHTLIVWVFLASLQKKEHTLELKES